mmetsp:Transcript_78731/g.163751  ORF Transcript_78731/g.163751 Transcript_78731/m.163751 type:complete len:505 (+) Transcript_78731:323-1837(+)
MDGWSDAEIGSENDRTALLASTSTLRSDCDDGVAAETCHVQASSSSQRKILNARSPQRILGMAVLGSLAVAGAVTLSTAVRWNSPGSSPSAGKPLRRADRGSVQKAWSIWPWQWFGNEEGEDSGTGSSSSSTSIPVDGDSVEAALDAMSKQDPDEDDDLDSLVDSSAARPSESSQDGPSLADTDALVDQPTDIFPDESTTMDPLDIYFAQLRGQSRPSTPRAPVDSPVAALQAGQLQSWPGVTYTLTSTTTTKLSSRVVLYCFAVMKTGGYEEPLLREQVRNKVGIFECDYSAVLSDAVVYLAGQTPEDKVLTENIGDLTCKYGGPYNLALNSGIFAKAWQRVFSDAVYRNADWTIKADPDAVFLPARLRTMLMKAEPTSLTYLNNCDQGLHGPIEVISVGAMNLFGSKLTECVQELSKEWSWAGEDVFLRHCLGYLNINRVDAFSLLKEDHCFGKNPKRDGCFTSEVSFHPFKDRDSWFRCWGQAREGSSSNTLVAKKRLLDS